MTGFPTIQIPPPPRWHGVAINGHVETGLDCVIDPFCLLGSEHGPLTIGRGARIRSHTVIEGDSGSTERTIHSDREGPLHDRLGGGGFALDAPRSPDRPQWAGTFGSILPCTETGPPAVITAVRPHVVVAPRKWEVVGRTAPSTDTDHDLTTWSTLLMRLGTLREITREQGGLDGEVTKDLKSLQIPTKCGINLDQTGYVELVLTMWTDAGGAAFDYLDVDYVWRGRPYTLRVAYEYILCGKETTQPFAGERRPACRDTVAKRRE